MRTTLEWLGVSTFRLTVGEIVIFLDAYMDRVPAAAPVGLSATEVTRADWILVGHSHFDHLAGAEVISKNTGARIIGSTETARVMQERGVPHDRLIVSHGGEHHGLADGVTVRVFPSLHACTWTHLADPDSSTSGDLGLTEEQRRAYRGLGHEIRDVMRSPEGAEIRQHIATAAGSLDHGGPLSYLIQTPAGSIYYHDTSGCWTGVLRTIESDVAILAAAGRANIDGEPVQGAIADFITTEGSLLGARRIVLAHHDDWMPPVTKPVDPAPIRAKLARDLSSAQLIEPAYLREIVVFE
jgi:L-ascorbate metabolism protein UlaG (beta-lactamase superfamily)